MLKKIKDLFLILKSEPNNEKAREDYCKELLMLSENDLKGFTKFWNKHKKEIK